MLSNAFHALQKILILSPARLEKRQFIISNPWSLPQLSSATRTARLRTVGERDYSRDGRHTRAMQVRGETAPPIIVEERRPSSVARTADGRGLMIPYPPTLQRICPWCRRVVVIVYVSGSAAKLCFCPPRQDRPIRVARRPRV
jgi:hypothetical protein